MTISGSDKPNPCPNLKTRFRPMIPRVVRMSEPKSRNPEGKDKKHWRPSPSQLTKPPRWTRHHGPSHRFGKGYWETLPSSTSEEGTRNGTRGNHEKINTH